MELLVALVGAITGGLISWAALRWQLRRQSVDAQARLKEQFQLTEAHARAETRLRMQIEEFQHIKSLNNQLFREFTEIHHVSGHILESPGDGASYRQEFKERVGNVRRLARGESRLLGDQLSRSILTATEVWLRFLDQPKNSLREAAFDASLNARWALDHFVEQQGQALGTDINGKLQ